MYKFDLSKRLSFVNRGDICHVDLGPKPEDDTIPMEYDENPLNLLRGFRFCMVLAVVSKFSVLVLPFTTSATYANSNFECSFECGKYAYPRFDMVIPVPVVNLSTKEFNIIDQFGKSAFDKFLNEYIRIITTSKISVVYMPCKSGKQQSERIRNIMIEKNSSESEQASIGDPLPMDLKKLREIHKAEQEPVAEEPKLPIKEETIEKTHRPKNVPAYDVAKVKASIDAYNLILIPSKLVARLESENSIQQLYNDCVLGYDHFSTKYKCSRYVVGELKRRYGLLPLNPDTPYATKKKVDNDAVLLEEFVLPLQQKRIKIHNSVISFITETKMKSNFVGPLNETYEKYCTMSKKAKIEMIPLNSFCNNLSYFGIMRTGSSLVGTGCAITK